MTSAPIYRADHVGSLLRPPELLAARSDAHISPDERRAIEDRHVLRVLARQAELGFRIFTDGELRRLGFMSDFYDSVDGLDADGSVARAWMGTAGAGTEGTNPLARLSGLVVEPIRQRKRLTKDEVDFLRTHAPGHIKVTLPSANQFPAIAYRRGLSERAYPSSSAFLWDVAAIIRAEIAALVREGVNYIQLDAPRYSYYIDPKWRSYLANEMGMEPEAALDEAIEVDNMCLDAARGTGVVLGIHLCRGNNRSQWYAEGGYDPVAEKLFDRLNVDLFLLEYDTERAGTFEPLRFVPSSKGVVLGLVSSKVPLAESAEWLMRRIDDASRYVPLANLALSPQCGFASTLEGNLLTEDEQWRKLQLVVDTARRVWPDA
jgi:5-methyltetrahydropteroyltriglutamate--homocysteine methyltransferase